MTPLNDLVSFVRAIVGDTHAAASEFSDDHILTALRLVLRGGKVSGYTLDPTMNQVDPALDEPNAWLLALYEAALVLVRPRTESYRYSTRALSESFGGQATLFWSLSNEVDAVQALRSGGLVQSWQDLRQFCAGNYGMPLWERLVEVSVERPQWRLNLDGLGLAPV